MTQEKPAEHILGELTRVGSSLAELATRELDVVIKDLSGPTGRTDKALPEADIGRGRVNVGTLASTALQLVSKLGDLLSQLSKYDLVRNDCSQITLNSANPVSEISVQANTEGTHGFLLGNDGMQDIEFDVTAKLLNLTPGKNDPPTKVDLTPTLSKILAGERHRLTAKIPKIADPSPTTGRYALTIEVRDRVKRDPPAARKTVLIKVLPLPKPND